MNIDKSQTAIQMALENNWEKAISLNQDIIAENPIDIDALNRLAYALTKLGKVNLAKKTYKKILSIDRYESIAVKNLAKIEKLNKNIKCEEDNINLSPSQFLEEPGKTKSVSLINLPPLSVISQLTIGKEVFLNPKKHSVEIRDNKKTYLGALPDDIAFRLIRLIKMGNKYTVVLKNVGKNCVAVFIKEASRSKKTRFQPSFIPTGTNEYATSIAKDFIEEEDEEKNDGESDQPAEE